MLFKNKYLPLKSNQLNNDEIFYLIDELNHWLHDTSNKYMYDFWHQSCTIWFSNKEIRKRERINSDMIKLDELLENLMSAAYDTENDIDFITINNEELNLINKYYKIMYPLGEFFGELLNLIFYKIE